MKRIPSSSTFPERPEIHADKTWHELGFNHKTTASMGMLIPLACKEVYPGELVKLQTEIKMRFAAMYLPIMHQCYFTCDWYYVTNRQLWPSDATVDNNEGWEAFIKQDPFQANTNWAWFGYKQSDAVFTSGLLNYLGFNAPPLSGTLIAETDVSALPVSAYIKIYDEYYRNDQIQPAKWRELIQGDNSLWIEAALPDLKVLRRNWPRDYYTSATPLPQQGANVLIPSYATDPISADFIPQQVFRTDGSQPGTDVDITAVSDGAGGRVMGADGQPLLLQLSSTIRDFRYAAQMTEYLERSMRAGDRYRDFVFKNFQWDPQPMFVDRPVWIGGYTGDVIISDVMATAKGNDVVVGDYAGKALASEITPVFSYQCPDYGLIMCLFTCYPKASYYSGLDNMWRRTSKMDYMWEQFAQIGDQPIKNKEVWFSWYDADIDWNEETFGYLPQYAQWRYSNDIVSGQMRTLWEAFHLGRKFTAASQVVLNSDFITCTPDIGRCFVVDAEAGEHEIYIHAYNKISILRRLGRFGLPQL